ncbi:MAG: autotransporter-associated beta strand repeat-containing protein [Planctomycetota bacterium]|jgi:autotransporter-associated beta strand protein
MNKAIIGGMAALLLAASPTLAAKVKVTAGHHNLQWSAGPMPIPIFTTGSGMEMAFGVDLRVSIVGGSPGPFIDSISLDEPGTLFEDPEYHLPFPDPQHDPGPQPTEALGLAADFRPLSSPRVVPATQTLLAVVNIDTSQVGAAGGTWDWLLNSSQGSTFFSGPDFSGPGDTVRVDGTISVGQPNQWEGDVDGSWHTLDNWTRSVPNATDAVANFLDTSGTRTVTVDPGVTVGAINFDNADGYTVAGPGEVSLQRSVCNARINVLEGSHTIEAPGSMLSDTEVVVDPGAALTLVGAVAGIGDLIKDGPGTLTLEAENTYLGDTRIRGGILEVASDGNLGHMSSGLWIDGGTLRTLGSFSGAREVAIGAAGATR